MSMAVVTLGTGANALALLRGLELSLPADGAAAVPPDRVAAFPLAMP